MVYDPAAMENARPELVGKVTFATSAADCARQSDVLAITTPWPEFRQLQAQDLKQSGARPTVLDCWRLLGDTDLRKCTDYLILGVGAHGPKN